MNYLDRMTIGAITVGLVSLAVLTGCTNTAKTASSATGMATTQPAIGTGVDSLLNVVNNTKAAVEAKDFPKAKSAPQGKVSF